MGKTKWRKTHSVVEVLTEKLRGVLKDALLVPAALPLTPEIRLYLLNPDYPHRSFTDEERRVLMDEPPYWAFCWSSGQVLAKWIRDCSAHIAGKRILDFGAGSGVAAVAAALCGAESVVALDCDPLSLEAIKANAALNGVALEATDALDSRGGQFDIIFAADVLYDRTNLSFLEVFTKLAPRVVVADSRIKAVPAPYQVIGTGHAVTCPDLDEPDELSFVRIFAYPS